jgi:hypothetical protein
LFTGFIKSGFVENSFVDGVGHGIVDEFTKNETICGMFSFDTLSCSQDDLTFALVE